jgi:hypothetical protein
MPLLRPMRTCAGADCPYSIVRLVFKSSRAYSATKPRSPLLSDFIANWPSARQTMSKSRLVRGTPSKYQPLCERVIAGLACRLFPRRLNVCGLDSVSEKMPLVSKTIR